MRHIHLLREDARQNKGPAKLVAGTLDGESDAKRIVYIGMKPRYRMVERESKDGGLMVGNGG